MMRKTALLLTLLAITYIYTPSSDVFAADSPVAETKREVHIGDPVTEELDEDDFDEDYDSEEGEEGKNSPGSNKSDTSPKTGSSVPFVMLALASSAGLSLVTKKKLED